MRKSPHRKRGCKRKKNRKQSCFQPPQVAKETPVKYKPRVWTTADKMRWARDAYWYGADEYALDVLMEIAQTEINDHVQETFDLECQPRPQRKKGPKPTIRSHVDCAGNSPSASFKKLVEDINNKL